MKSRFTLIFLTIFCICSCNQKTSVNQTSNDQSTADKSANLKDLEDYKLSLLGDPISKVDEILGEPDTKGNSYSFKTGHYIYYNKVIDRGEVKHLVIYYVRIGRNAPYRTVEDIQAISDGGTYANSRYGSFVVQKPVGFSSKNSGVDNLKSQIDLKVKSVNLNTLNTYDEPYINGKAYFYYDDQLHLKAIKYSWQYVQGFEDATIYYFDNDKLIYISSKTPTSKIKHSEKYVQNDEVKVALYDGDEKPCSDGADCYFDKFSNAYKLLDQYYAGQGD
ncbi:hypothetical protein [Pedobacter miscanthi]|uniref:Uncharacterized protein n=1 Tax=Pedobacter miscanthi TaxID=2259170 RepID=A0A366KMD1_9SPHI|nr:hypothetical protein [Pedobacter miscanthi]RBQ02815.1 hypothetical protein DRW42_24505 [Pedobacter miscanthi]